MLFAQSLTFAGFLLFSGRLADIFNAAFVFELGFAAMGVFCLIMSFVTNKYGFLILRALAGICGSFTIPSAINLIVRLYREKEEQQVALSIFGLSGAIANMLGALSCRYSKTG